MFTTYLNYFFVDRLDNKEHDSMQSSITSIYNKNKLEKYWLALSKHFKLNSDISIDAAGKVLKIYEQENDNPIQVFYLIYNTLYFKLILPMKDVLNENKNTKQEDLIFLKEYIGQSTKIWSHLVSPKKRKR